MKAPLPGIYIRQGFVIFLFLDLGFLHPSTPYPSHAQHKRTDVSWFHPAAHDPPRPFVPQLLAYQFQPACPRLPDKKQHQDISGKSEALAKSNRPLHLLDSIILLSKSWRSDFADNMLARLPSAFFCKSTVLFCLLLGAHRRPRGPCSCSRHCATCECMHKHS